MKCLFNRLTRSVKNSEGINSKTFGDCFFYTLLADKSTCKFWLNACIVLFVPYIMLSLGYFVNNDEPITYIFNDSRGTLAFASIWYILGPILVYKCIKSFIGLSSKNEFTVELKTWLVDNAANNYKFYKRCMYLFSSMLITVVVLTLLLRPNILVDAGLFIDGYSDVGYWLILLFLSWFLVYCSNALSIIALTAMVVYTIKKNDILSFNPTNINHHNCIKQLYKFCNRVVFYMCSGLLYLPLAIYFLWNQMYITWVLTLLLLYGLFLIVAITYPKSAIKSYAKAKSNAFVMEESLKYLNNFKALKFYENSIELQLQIYNSRMYLDELKKFCRIRMPIDSSTVLTYISIFVTLSTFTGQIIFLLY